MTDREDLLYAIVCALADAEGVDPSDLSVTLADAINPTVLESLMAETNEPWEFTFQVRDHEVTVSHTGTVSVDGQTYGGRDDESDGSDGRERRLGRESTPTVLASLPGFVYRRRNRHEWPMVFVAGGCRELTGYDPEALTIGGVSYGADVVHPDDRDDVWETVQRSLRLRRPFRIDYRIHTAGGSQKRVWELGAGVFEDGTAVLLEGFVTEYRSGVFDSDGGPATVDSNGSST